MKKVKWLFYLTLLSVVLMTGCSQAAPTNDPNAASGNSPTSSVAPDEEAATREPQAATQNPSSSVSDEQAINEAIKVAEIYKNIEYNVTASDELLSEESIQKRTEEMKSFFTEGFAEKAVDTRYTIMVLQVAEAQQASVTSENLKFTVSNQKKDMVELIYTADLILLDQENKESNRVPLQGTLTLFNENGKWLIQGDRFDKPAFAKLSSPLE
ncbi:hypothetical protein NST28_31400 [Paenibacillus sp. FSL R10-2791]|uniref:hypothetical protein n=1 Tax=unclassified Paenibacillus TaxID=185978 RepID=UPI0030F7737C